MVCEDVETEEDPEDEFPLLDEETVEELAELPSLEEEFEAEDDVLSRLETELSLEKAAEDETLPLSEKLEDESEEKSEESIEAEELVFKTQLERKKTLTKKVTNLFFLSNIY